MAGITGFPGTYASQLADPCDLALDSSNALYVVDRKNHRVQKWLMGVSTATTVAGRSDGVFGSTLSDLNFPTAVEVDSSNGNIYVVDGGNHRVVLWTSGSSSGVIVAGTGMEFL